MLDFASLPPEVNSGLMYAGPGTGPMLTASSAWASLSAELNTMASAYEAVIASLADGSWLGPAAASMATSSQAQVDWLAGTAVQAEQVAAQAAAAVSAYEAAFIATVPPPEVAANRALLLALVATNLLGQNTPAILATEAQYAEMWAQDVAAMYGYAGAASAASTLEPFAVAVESVDPAGFGAQASAVAEAVGSTGGQSVTDMLSALAGDMATPPWLGSLENFLDVVGVTGHAWNANGDGIVVGGLMGDLLEGLTGSQTLDASSGFDAFIRLISPTRLFATVFRDIEGLGRSMLPAVSKAGSVAAALPPSLPAGLPGAAMGGLGRAELVGRLSVPPNWGGAAPSVSPAVTSVGNLGTPVSSQPLTAQPVANSMGGLPIVSNSGGRGMQFASPRYGFKPTVVPRPPVGG